MEYPQAYIGYLVHFHATRDYFECHELLEEYWKSQPKDDPLSDTWIGLIQLAVAQYHHRRGNTSGARKMLEQASRRLKPGPLAGLGLDGVRLAAAVTAMYHAFAAGDSQPPFRDIALPITDPALMEACRAASDKLGAEWERKSPLTDDALIQKHTLRDRSQVISARKRSLDSKKRSPS